MNRILFRLLCVLLLLVGQEAALTHALSHAHGRLARTAATAVDEVPQSQDRSSGERFALCDFDYAYSQVLGGVQGKAPPSCPAIDAAHALNAARASTTHVAVFLAPYSRGPPAYS